MGEETGYTYIEHTDILHLVLGSRSTDQTISPYTYTREDPVREDRIELGKVDAQAKSCSMLLCGQSWA